MRRLPRWFGSLLLCTLIAGCRPAPTASGDLERRVAALEQARSDDEAEMAFLRQVYQAQQTQEQAELAREPAPDAVFAVDITGNQVQGPTAGAYVTIIEAWDFA